MVRIAVAGGTGNVAQEIIHALVATGKHDIMILSRKSRLTSEEASDAISYAVTDYSSVDDLTSLLHGCHTVLSFVAAHLDQTEAFEAQKKLIDASIAAGVRRFAPSEWVSAGLEHMPWYSFKAQTRDYLTYINRDSRVLEYCLFQPGLFTNYLTHPYKSAEFVAQMETPLDFGGRRMLVIGGGRECKITFTTVRDLANVVVCAVEMEEPWPVVGGMRGSELSFEEVVVLGEKLRGPFNVERLDPNLLKAGTWTSSWLPKIEHPSIAPEHADAMSKSVTAGILLAIEAGAFESNDAWNRLLADYRFETAEEFLAKAWEGKP